MNFTDIEEIDTVDDSCIVSSSNPFTGAEPLNVIRYIVTKPDDPQYGVGDVTYYDVEQQPRIGFYRSPEIAELICTKAKPNTVKLLMYIMYRLMKHNEDFITIKPLDTREILDISKATLYTAISELETFKVITRKQGRNQYWINVKYLFFGNRIEYIRNNAPNTIRVVRTKRV